MYVVKTIYTGTPMGPCKAPGLAGAQVYLGELQASSVVQADS